MALGKAVVLASAQAEQHTGQPHRAMRRGGWNPKPRINPAHAVLLKKWCWDASKSQWWPLFNDDNTYNERSYQGMEFYEEFRMPRVILRGC